MRKSTLAAKASMRALVPDIFLREKLAEPLVEHGICKAMGSAQLEPRRMTKLKGENLLVITNSYA